MSRSGLGSQSWTAIEFKISALIKVFVESRSLHIEMRLLAFADAPILDNVQDLDAVMASFGLL